MLDCESLVRRDFSGLSVSGYSAPSVAGLPHRGRLYCGYLINEPSSHVYRPLHHWWRVYKSKNQ